METKEPMLANAHWSYLPQAILGEISMPLATIWLWGFVFWFFLGGGFPFSFFKKKKSLG